MGYISFPRIGYSGNLGSQLSQYSALYAVAKNNGLDVVFPESSVYDGWGHKFAAVFNMETNYISDKCFSSLSLPYLGLAEYNRRANGIPQSQNFSESVTLNWELLPVNSRHVTKDRLLNLDKNKNYWVDELFHMFEDYHPNYREEILSWRWNKDKYAAAKKDYDKIKVEGKELVSIHVRRGDYLSHDHFCKLDQDYYNEALSYFTEDMDKYHFVVFSNDIPWCKENLIEGNKVTFVDPPGQDIVQIKRSDYPIEMSDDASDLILMSMCDHNIIANSSFSWWAAYTNSNPNKKVIYPQNYVKWNSPVAIDLNDGKYAVQDLGWIPVKNTDKV